MQVHAKEVESEKESHSTQYIKIAYCDYLHLENDFDCSRMSANMPGVDILYNGRATETKANIEGDNTADWSEIDGVHSQMSSLDENSQCELYDAEYAQVRNLNVHISAYRGQEDLQTLLPQDSSFTEKPDKTYICSVCKKQFSHSLSLKTNQGKHSGQILYTCNDCHWDKPYKCTECGETFRALIYLKVHRRGHKSKKPYMCADCGQAFVNFSEFSQHERVHSGDKHPVGKGLSTKSFSNVRINRHTGDKPYKCTDCGKVFENLAHLKLHQGVDTREMSFKCTYCGKRFLCLSLFGQHRRLHARDMSYKCLYCGRSFAYLCQLKDHQLLHKR